MSSRIIESLETLGAAKDPSHCVCGHLPCCVCKFSCILMGILSLNASLVLAVLC